jgi:glycosyltransferase involved in cell wall biosynthesis
MHKGHATGRARIAHIISGLTVGGAERALSALLGGGLKERFESLVLSLDGGGKMATIIRETGTEVVTLNIGHGRNYLTAVPELLRVIKHFEPQIIQGWMYHGNLAATVASSFMPRETRLAWNVRQTLYDLSLEKPLTRWVIRANRMLSGRPEMLLYNSSMARQQHERFGFSAKRAALIPNGIDLDGFSFSESLRTARRSELAFPKDSVVIGHVARLHPMKDHQRFLRVGESIAARHPNVHFLLIGRNVTWDSELLAPIRGSKFAQRVVALGERSDVKQLYSAMDLLCSTSAWGEGFPNVLGEAMASGLPCVTTDVGDSAVVAGHAGIVVPPKDDDALLAALLKLVDMSPDERRDLGARGRAHIRSNFSIGAIVKQYSAAYEQLLAPGEAA